MRSPALQPADPLRLVERGIMTRKWIHAAVGLCIGAAPTSGATGGNCTWACGPSADVEIEFLAHVHG